MKKSEQSRLTVCDRLTTSQREAAVLFTYNQSNHRGGGTEIRRANERSASFDSVQSQGMFWCRLEFHALKKKKEQPVSSLAKAAVIYVKQ